MVISLRENSSHVFAPPEVAASDFARRLADLKLWTELQSEFLGCQELQFSTPSPVRAKCQKCPTKEKNPIEVFSGSSFLVNWPRIAPIDVDARGYASTLCNPGSPVDHFKKGSDLVIRKKVFLCLAEHGSSNWTFVGFDESPCQGRPPRMPHRVFDLKPGVTGFGSCWLTRMFTTKHLRRAMGSWFWTPRTRFWKRGYGLDTPNMGVPGIYGYQHIQLSRT